MGSLLGGKGGTSGQGAEGSGTSKTTPGFQTELSGLLNSVLDSRKGSRGYTKENALQDVQGVLRTQATDALQQVMPSIASVNIGSGAYNSTTKQLMQNDAGARITAQLANTQLQAIKDYAAIENDTIKAVSDAAKAGTSSESEYSQKSWGNSKTGGSGLLGLFEDGGEVPEQTQDETSAPNRALEQFMKTSGIGAVLDSVMTVKDSMTGAGKGVGDVAKSLMSDQDKKDLDVASSVLSLVTGGMFADGGQVPETSNSLSKKFAGNLFEQTRQRREQEAGLNDAGGAGITINVNTGGGNGSSQQQQPKQQQPSDAGGLAQQLRALLGFEDGGKVPDHMKLIEAIRHHANGGQVRTGESDVNAGGKIRGPETKSGKDNQVIAVGGGEGILAKDVMDVPGVPELVKALNDRFHTPSK